MNNSSHSANNNLNTLSTSEYLDSFGTCYAGGVFTHGVNHYITVEYFKPDSDGLSSAHFSGVTQGIYGATDPWFYSSGVDDSGNVAWYGLAVPDSWVKSNIKWGNDSAIFLNIACLRGLKEGAVAQPFTINAPSRCGSMVRPPIHSRTSCHEVGRHS